MALKKRKGAHRKKLGCPYTKSRSRWCHAICEPKLGERPCGRHAYHAYMGRTSRAILEYKEARAEEEKKKEKEKESESVA